MAVACLLVSGCSGAWRQAQRAHTGAAYRAFATENPDHPRAEVALERAEALDWARATEMNTPEGYLAYVAAYPGGPHATEALVAGEALAWEAAKAANTPEALSGFLARFPSTDKHDEASELIEAAWFERARLEGTEASWARYLLRYPEGSFVEAAKAERERLAWQATLEANDLAAYTTFATRFPASEHRPEALAWIDATRVSVLQPVVMLGESLVPEDARVDRLVKYRRELDETLLYDLRRDFRIKRTLMVDLKGGPPPHPQEAFGTEADTGLLVLTVADATGRDFEPSGEATDIEASLALYAPPTDTPIWRVGFSASTPGQAFGNTERALDEAAIADLGSHLRAYAPELIDGRKAAR